MRNMDIMKAIAARKSIRGYKPTPVPREVLEKVVDAGLKSPSGMNTQPWEIIVIGGDVLSMIKQANMERFQSGHASNPDYGITKFEGVYRERQVALAIQLFGLLGIAREDKEKRLEWNKKGLRFYDAPVAIILLTDQSLFNEKMPIMDVGGVSQTIALAALASGLGTCIVGQGVAYPDILRLHAGIPDSKKILIGICIGYPDWDFPANKVVAGRCPYSSVVRWSGV